MAPTLQMMLTAPIPLTECQSVYSVASILLSSSLSAYSIVLSLSCTSSGRVISMATACVRVVSHVQLK